MKAWLGMTAFLLAGLFSRPSSQPIDVLLAPQPVPPGKVLFIYALDKPAVMVPRQFSEEVRAVIECESGWDTGAVGPYGELGLLQVHPIHFPRMRSLGLDPLRAADRVRFAVILWQENGLKDWESSRNCWKGELNKE